MILIYVPFISFFRIMTGNGNFEKIKKRVNLAEHPLFQIWSNLCFHRINDGFKGLRIVHRKVCKGFPVDGDVLFSQFAHKH